MIGLGTLVNVVAIIVCSLIGMGLGHKLPERVHDLLTKAMGLVIVGIGLKMFLATQHIVIVLLSLVLGALVGELLGIEAGLETCGHKLKKMTRSKSSHFLECFVTASLIYCVGPMAIIGAMTDGMGAGHEILFAKSILDGTISITLATTLGVGVLFSFIPVLLYQGGFTVLAFFLGHFFAQPLIAELTATGGLLIAGIGINILGQLTDRNRIAVGNLLPAIVIAPVLLSII